MKEKLKRFLAGLTACIVAASRQTVALANEVWYENGRKTYSAEAAISTRYILVKHGTTAGTEVDICGATDSPIGIAEDEASADEYVSIAHLGITPGTLPMVASKAIDIGEKVYTTSGGKVTDTPAAGATLVGTALSAATADGDVIVVAHQKPEKPSLIGSGVHSWAGGAATTDSIDVSSLPGGLLATDLVFVHLMAVASTETLSKALNDAGNDQIDITLSANGTNTTTKLAWAVYR